MRYFLQVSVMLGDIALFAACFVVLRSATGLWGPVMVLFALYAWKDVGGLEAWNPKVIRQFMKNARKLGW